MREYKYRDLTGEKFGKWTVIERTKKPDTVGDYERTTYWLCECECTRKKVISSNSLLRGKSKSCFCLSGEKARERGKLPEGEATFNRIFARYKNGAKSRGLIFELNKEYFRNLISKNCYYCNKEPSYYKAEEYSNGGIYHSGIDRVDNSIGYIEGNCVPCCSKCNHSKANYSYDEFLLLVKNIYENLNLNSFGVDK